MKRRALLHMVVASFAVLLSGESLAKGRSGGGGSKKSGGSNYRSAKSGKYVKKGYAEKNRNTTVKEKRK